MAFTRQRRPAPGMNTVYGNNALQQNPAPGQPVANHAPQQVPQQTQRNPASNQGSPDPRNGGQFRQPGNQAPAPQNTRQQTQGQYRQNSGNAVPQGQQQVPNGQPRHLDNRQAPPNQMLHPSGGQYQQENPGHQQHQQALQKNTVPAAQERAAAVDPGTANASYMSCKIWKINGNKKVMDFTSNLIQAKVQDFANIHGIGGSGHAPNSTVGISLCDYTKGTGKENSFTVRYNVDVEDMEMLYNAAMAARLGLLRMMPPLNPGQSKCTFAYVKQKSNPYQKSNINGETYVPASTLEILYDPSRNYPWIIQITNCLAPLVIKPNGASNHEASRAINQTKTNIFVSADDFCAAMTAVKRFVRLWEQRMFRTVDVECRRYEAYLEEKNKKNYAN